MSTLDHQTFPFHLLQCKIYLKFAEKHFILMTLFFLFKFSFLKINLVPLVNNSFILRYQYYADLLLQIFVRISFIVVGTYLYRQ